LSVSVLITSVPEACEAAGGEIFDSVHVDDQKQRKETVRLAIASETQRDVSRAVAPRYSSMVYRRLPIAAARFRTWHKACGICGEQSGAGQVFSQYFGFPGLSFVSLIAVQTSPYIIQD
jgi:hypothetical protein